MGVEVRELGKEINDIRELQWPCRPCEGLLFIYLFLSRWEPLGGFEKKSSLLSLRAFFQLWKINSLVAKREAGMSVKKLLN